MLIIAAELLVNKGAENDDAKKVMALPVSVISPVVSVII